MQLPHILNLMIEARKEIYELIDKYHRPMPKKADGTIDEYAKGLANNDIDALRHAYVSGVYTIEYGEITADLFGRLNELRNFNFGMIESPSVNMDLWNNSIGRKYGKKSKSRQELFENLINALKSNELIIELNDERKYKGAKTIKRLPKSYVIKIKETKTGANIEFFDIRKKIIMTKEEFIHQIRNNQYPGYSIKKHHSGEFPISTRDRFNFNNLG
jgi:hypothetical protein